MVEAATSFLDFLESIYGRDAVDQIGRASELGREEIEKASQSFVPAFLESMMKARTKSSPSSSGSSGDAPSFANFWPKEMTDAMQDFMAQSADAAAKFSPTSSEENTAFPFNVFADQNKPMLQLYQAFMGQVAHTELLAKVSKSTGIPTNQLNTLFPMLTTYGLMPLMPPTMDDPAGWVGYLGEMGRRNFRQANRELDAMPSPVAAAFSGLLAGFFPASQTPEPSPASQEADKMQEVREASLTMQANYMKGLNSLFDSYQAGLNTTGEDETDKH